MLICAQCLPLVSGLGTDRGALRTFPFTLLSLPCSLLRLTLALLAALCLGPGSNDPAAPTSRHRPSLSDTTVLSAPPGHRSHLKNTTVIRRTHLNLPYSNNRRSSPK
jgi:hypothetical protein